MRIRSKVHAALEALTKSAFVADKQATDDACMSVSSKDLEALRAIEDGVETQSALATKLSVSVSFVAHVLDKLETEGLATRIVVRGERRKTVKLTKQGRQMIEKFRGIDAECRKRVIEDFGIDGAMLDAIVEKVWARRRRP